MLLWPYKSAAGAVLERNVGERARETRHLPRLPHTVVASPVALLLPRLLHSSLPRNHHRCWLLNAVFLALAAARGLGPSRRWQQQTFRPEYCEGEEVAGECRWPDGESGGLSPRLAVCSPAAAAGRGRSQVLLFRRRGGGGGGNGARRRACAAAALVSSFLVRSFSSGAAAARGLIGGGEDS